MCRIIAIYGNSNNVAISNALTKFGALAETGVVPKSDPAGHNDGWGLVAYDRKDNIVIHGKEPLSAANNPAFEALIEKISHIDPSIVIGHLRKASVGGNKIENTHPFFVDGWTFCHNGSIGVKDDMAGLVLDAEYASKRKGETDSETFFLYYLQSLKGTASTNPAILQQKLVDLINLIRTTRDYTALNLLVTNGKTLFAVREANEKNAWVKKENLCDYYYTLFLGKSTDKKSTIVCSQKLDLDGMSWSEIPNHSLLAVNLETGEENIAAI